MNNNEHLIPIFPVTALPKAVADMCNAVSENMQVPLEMPSSVALGVLASCCQRKATVRVKADFVEPLNLFVLTIAESGEKKTPVFSILNTPIYQAQKEYIQKHDDEIAHSQLEYELLNKQLEDAKNGRYKGDKDIFEINKELRNFKRLIVPKLFLDDVTPEKLIDILAEQGGSTTISSAESGIFIDLKKQAATSGSFDVYFKAYNGDHIDVARIMRAGNTIEDPRLTLNLTAQTGIAKEMMNNKMFRAKGLPARFLCALCRQNEDIRYGDTPDIPLKIKERYNALIRRLLDYSLDRESPTYEIKLTSDGYEAFLKYDYENKLKFALGGDYEHMRDWGNKAIGKMLRIAGIIAVCENRKCIDAGIMLRAYTLADWYTANAEVLLLNPKPKETESPTDYLLKKLKKWDSTKKMTVNAVRTSTQNKTNFNFDNALEELKSDGLVKIEKQGKSEYIVLTL